MTLFALLRFTALPTFFVAVKPVLRTPLWGMKKTTTLCECCAFALL